MKPLWFGALLAAWLLFVGLALSQETRIVPVGSTFTVALPYTAGTGYSWRVTKQADAAVVHHVGHVGHELDRGRKLGESGHAIFQFAAVAPGETSVQLEYRRWWEKGLKPMRTFDLKVVVTK